MQNSSPINLGEAGAATDIINAVGAKPGGVPSIFATMAQSPAVFESYLAFTNYFNHVANTEIDIPFVTAAANNSDA